MFDYLVKHALENVWCTPDQDNQYVYKPARITGARGVNRLFDVEWQTIFLPNATDRFHVFQIGQIHPLLLGLKTRHKRWYSAAETMMSESVQIDLYTVNGIQFPRKDCYIQVMGDRNLLVAVKLQPKLPDLEKEALFVRVYSNAFLASDRSRDVWQPMVVDGITVTDPQQLNAFQSKWDLQRQQPGLTNLFWNGKLVDRFYTTKIVPGDLVEFVYDASVKATFEWAVADLQTFDSDIDLLRKYLLHRPKGTHETIDYLDDLDLYIVKKNDVNGYSGVYFHKNNRNTVRMVTHQDYAVPVPYVVGYATAFADWKDIKDLTLRAHIRHSGWDRPLVNEAHRIKELYKLPEPLLPRAMLGIDSTVSVWRAPALEASKYPVIMGSAAINVTPLLVQQAYGYNAIAMLMADTPQRTTLISGQRMVLLPPGLRENATVYEYDSNGRLLGFYTPEAGGTYVCRNHLAAMIEAYRGVGGVALTTVYNKATSTIDPDHNYRFYKTPIHLGVPLNQWQDVTGTTDYTIVNGKVTWNVDRDYWYTCVRDDLNFLAYNYRVTPTDGLIRFSIVATETHDNGASSAVLQIPMGALDLWLNGYPLIEDLDYYVVGAQIVICNKRYWVVGTQTLTVRYTGFCNSDLTRPAPAEYGFVVNGALSRNGHYNLRDDKVIRIVVEGALKHRSDLSFIEDSPMAQMTGVRNGAPYVIEDVVVPIEGLTGTETYAYRAESVAIDREIENYMTLKLPEPVPVGPPIITPERYEVYSPWTCKIMNDLINGILVLPGIAGHYNEMDIQTWLKPYDWLLPYDPCRNAVNTGFVVIDPHNLYTVKSMNINQYTFLDRAIKLYLDDKVDLTHFVSVVNG